MIPSQDVNSKDRRSFLKWSLLSCSAIIATIAGSGALLAKKNEQQILVLADSAQVLTDVSRSDHFRLTPTQNFILANPINGWDGQKIIWQIVQDSIGSRRITLDDKFIFSTDLNKIELTSAPRKSDYITAIYYANTDKWHVVAFIRGF